MSKKTLRQVDGWLAKQGILARLGVRERYPAETPSRPERSEDLGQRPRGTPGLYEPDVVTLLKRKA